MASDIESAQSALDAAKQSHRNDPDVVMTNLKENLAAGAPKMHRGGEVPADGTYELEAGEHVLTSDQAEQLPEGAVSQPSPAVHVDPEPDKFAAVGGKFVGKTPVRANEIRNAPLATAASSLPETSPFFDPAARVLNLHGQALDLGTKADLWDAVNQSRDPQTLATKLSQPNFDHVPNGVKHELYIAHAVTMPAQSHTDKVVDAMNRLSQMDSKTLEVAEKHPNVLRAFTSAKE